MTEPALFQHMDMMSEEIVTLLTWFWRGMALVGALALGLGLVSALVPRRSIALYQRIMLWFNWRVEPVNEAHEVHTTRWLGVLLIGLAVVALRLAVAQGR